MIYYLKNPKNSSRALQCYLMKNTVAVILQYSHVEDFSVLASERHKAEIFQCVRKHLLYFTY